MIKLELSQTELNELVRVIGKLSGAPSLNKLENFRLQDGNRIAFDQSIKLSATPLIELSVDSSGRLLIDIIRLADSGIGNFFLQMFESKITGIIADKSNGKLHKESSSQLLFRLRFRESLRLQFRFPDRTNCLLLLRFCHRQLRPQAGMTVFSCFFCGKPSALCR